MSASAFELDKSPEDKINLLAAENDRLKNEIEQTDAEMEGWQNRALLAEAKIIAVRHVITALQNTIAEPKVEDESVSKFQQRLAEVMARKKPTVGNQ